MSASCESAVVAAAASECIAPAWIGGLRVGLRMTAEREGYHVRIFEGRMSDPVCLPSF